jgi:hypothetical protein
VRPAAASGVEPELPGGPDGPQRRDGQLAADGTLCIMSTAEAHVLADVAGVSSDPVPGLVVELR